MTIYYNPRTDQLVLGGDIPYHGYIDIYVRGNSKSRKFFISFERDKDLVKIGEL